MAALSRENMEGVGNVNSLIKGGDKRWQHDSLNRCRCKVGSVVLAMLSFCQQTFLSRRLLVRCTVVF